MKSIIFSLFLLAAGSTVCFAQCDKKVSITSSKSEQLDGSGAVQGTRDEKTTLHITASDITVSVVSDEGEQKLTGPIKSKTCDWKTPYKDGKMVITTHLNDGNSNDKDFTITIEGKDGKITLVAESPQMPDRKIGLVIDKFEEEK